MTPWYLQPEAKSLLVQAALEGLRGTYHERVRMSDSSWVSFEGPIYDRLNELHYDFTIGLGGTRDDIMARGFDVTADCAMEFANGAESACYSGTRPDDFEPVLNAIAAASLKVAA